MFTKIVIMTLNRVDSIKISTNPVHYKTSRYRLALIALVARSIQQVQTSANCIGYNNGPYLLVMK